MAKFKDTFELVDKVSKPLLKMSRKFAELDKSIGKSQKRLERFKKQTENIAKIGDKVKSVGKGMTVGLTLPIIAAGGAMVKLASDLEEANNKVEVAFGSSSDKIKKWAETSIDKMGLAKGQALDSAALYGDMATGMGLSQEKAASMAMTLTQLSADLASFKNISNDVAQTALKSIFTGETESLKNLGVVMTEANLKQFAMSKGIRKNIKNMTEQEKVQLRLNYVLEKTKNAQGDFERTGGGAANQMRIFQNRLVDLGETFGQYLLPWFTKAIIKINGMLKAFSKLSPNVQKGILIFGAILAVIGPLVTVIGSLITAFAGLNVVLGFLAANPIAAVILGIVAAITALILITKALWKNWEKIPAWLKGLMGVLMPIIGVIELIIAGIKKIQEWRNKGNQEVIDNTTKKVSSNKKGSKGDNNSINNSNNTTTTNITNNNYSAGANPRNAQYAK
jgi:uncharacterized membrane protein